MIFDKDPTADDRTGFDLTTPMIDAFNASRQEMLDQTRIVMREMQQTQGRALEYESFTTTVTPGGLTQVLGFDLSRLKMKLHAHGSGVYVGKRTQLAGGNQGYRLPAGSDIELTAVGELYAMVSANAQNSRTNLANDKAASFTSYGNGAGNTATVNDPKYPSGYGARLTFTTAPTDGWSYYLNTGSIPVLTGGQQITAAVQVTNSWVGAVVGIVFEWHDQYGNTVGYSPITSSTTISSANTPFAVMETQTVPKSATNAGILVQHYSGALPPVNGTVVISSLDVEAGATVPPTYIPYGVTGAPIALSVWVEKSAQ